MINLQAQNLRELEGRKNIMNQSFSELNQKAYEFGLTICGSHARDNRFCLASMDAMHRTPDVTIEIIGEWLEDLSNVDNPTTRILLKLANDGAMVDENERQEAYDDARHAYDDAIEKGRSEQSARDLASRILNVQLNAQLKK